MKKSPPTLLLLYVLLTYVVIQFVWWAYLIYDLNVELIYASSANMATQLEQQLRQKLFMILGEGTVFISLLLIGAFFIRRYALREQRIAHQERNFLLATTHELNSPIAAAKLNLQTLSRSELREDQKNQMIASGLENINRLEKLVSNILTASRIDAGKYVLNFEVLELDKSVDKVVRQMTPLIEANEVELSLELDTNLRIKADQAAIELVIENLIQNAIKYAPKSNLVISTRTKGKSACILVKDSGPGLDQTHLKNVFNKFYRAENEETRSKKGTGLGLYLVSEIIGAHYGTIDIWSEKGQGFSVEIFIPKIT